jgi:hypothetical protein
VVVVVGEKWGARGGQCQVWAAGGRGGPGAGDEGRGRGGAEGGGDGKSADHRGGFSLANPTSAVLVMTGVGGCIRRNTLSVTRSSCQARQDTL